VTPRLYACHYNYAWDAAPDLTCQFAWSPGDDAWQALRTASDVARLVVSQDGETLLVQIVDNRLQFRFVKAKQDLTADVPLCWMMGEPAWDEHRLWVPTASGLYEVDRGTGRLTWLVYRIEKPPPSGPYAADFVRGQAPWATYPNGPLFFGVLKHGDRLYLATSRGLYYHEIPAFTAK
jgi:hypothetical protein